ncbi:platelet-activating factor acetylhydrolase isoform II [Streptomyces sp. 2132.2]|uniref:alpha/beta hydrolase family protein n=1 Tax=Streptomyces sp. 2132.2 TaxID=2485161 RepID=UPI000F45FB8A|nr:alpha/beta hydrolase [Streptomyces sp. 2132.2]ROQ94375.1 platelet-activating factor acetylhydrolase isoform II [Streptomyces sp. 2132.2]
MNRRRTAAALALLALLLPLPLAAAGTAVAAGPPAASASASSDVRVVRPELPFPTGRFAVGQQTLHLVDRSRTDPWAGSGPRELMVTMRYPAQRGTGGPVRPWLTYEEARLLLADRKLDGSVAAGSLVGTKAYARSDARPVAGRYPLIVLSPGFTVPRATLTSLAEELASRGYVVAAVDHAYETSGTAFPGGRVLTCLACEKAGSEEGARLVTENRARDVSFLLDRLTGRHPAWKDAGLIDPGRIAMAGHSIGGSAAVAAMATDPRIRAGIDMDGGVFSPVPAGGLGGRPFLMLGAQESRPGNTGTGEASWDPNWKRLDGWKRWITFDASNHFTFTDWPTMSDQLGLPPLSPLPGARSVDLTRRYVGAFFDQHLKGIAQPLLDGPDPQAPEVRFHAP